MNYAFDRSMRGPLAEEPDLHVDITVSRCERRSPRRAVWKIRLTVSAPTGELVRERGEVTATRRRATVEVVEVPTLPPTAG